MQSSGNAIPDGKTEVPPELRSYKPTIYLVIGKQEHGELAGSFLIFPATDNDY